MSTTTAHPKRGPKGLDVSHKYASSEDGPIQHITDTEPKISAKPLEPYQKPESNKLSLPKADSIETSLAQALKKKDIKLLAAAIQQRLSHATKQKTVQRLPPELLPNFVYALAAMLNQPLCERYLPQTLEWVKVLLTTHASVFMAEPSLTKALASVYRTLEFRCASHHKLLALQLSTTVAMSYRQKSEENEAPTYWAPPTHQSDLEQTEENEGDDFEDGFEEWSHVSEELSQEEGEESGDKGTDDEEGMEEDEGMEEEEEDEEFDVVEGEEEEEEEEVREAEEDAAEDLEGEDGVELEEEEESDDEMSSVDDFVARMEQDNYSSE